MGGGAIVGEEGGSESCDYLEGRGNAVKATVETGFADLDCVDGLHEPVLAAGPQPGETFSQLAMALQIVSKCGGAEI